MNKQGWAAINIRLAVGLLLVVCLFTLTIPPAYAHAAPRRITAAAQQGEVTWIGSTEGLWRYEAGQITPIELPFLDAHITALYHDGAALWVGTYSTIGRFVQGEGWQTWQRGEAGLPSAWARGFTTFQGQVVAGSYDRGVAAWDGQGWQTIPNAPLRITAVASGGNALYATTVTGESYRYDGSAWQPLAGDTLLPATTPALPALPIERTPKAPIILIHGLGDSNTLSDSNMRFLAQWLEADGYPLYYLPFNPTAPLLANVTLMETMVATVQSSHPTQKPILIAHSFGGLLAQSYLAVHPDAAAGLISLGTPYAGVRLAYDFVVPELAAEPNPQWRELLPEHTALLEPFWGNAQIPQLHIAGDLLPRENFFEGFPPHDGIVDSASAVAAPGATRVYPLLHGWTINTMRYGIDSYLYPQSLYFTTLRPFLASLASTPPTNRALTPLLTSPGFTQRPIVVATLEPNSTTRATVLLDGEPATWFLNGEGVEMSLIAPDGKRYTGADTGIGRAVSHLPYRENLLQPLDLWSTEQAGRWQVELTNGSRNAVPVRLTLIQPQKPTLNVTVTTPWVAPGEAVRLEAETLPAQSLTAIMGDSVIPLVEIAAGRYQATLPAPPTPGYYPLRVTDGTNERWAVVTVRSLEFQVGAPTLIRTAEAVRVELPVVGNGMVAVGVRILQGEATIAATLQPMTLTERGSLSVTLPIALSAAEDVQWQLFDANGALVPVTSLAQLP